jgi:hypothetical protein
MKKTTISACLNTVYNVILWSCNHFTYCLILSLYRFIAISITDIPKKLLCEIHCKYPDFTTQFLQLEFYKNVYSVIV